MFKKTVPNLKTKNIEDSNLSDYIEILQAGCSVEQILQVRKDYISILYFLHYFLFHTGVSRRATRRNHKSPFCHDIARATV